MNTSSEISASTAAGMKEEMVEALSKAKEQAYQERNACVAGLARAVMRLRGGRAWLARHDASDKSWDKDWMTIVYIQLPNGGQLSWHIHDSEVSGFAFLFGEKPAAAWDGHDTKQKYARLAEWVNE